MIKPHPGKSVLWNFRDAVIVGRFLIVVIKELFFNLSD